MILCGVTAHGEDDVRIANINPSVGHGPSAEGGRQTGDRGGMSEAALLVQIYHPQGPHGLYQEEVHLTGISTAPDSGHTQGAVNYPVFFILGLERPVPGVFYMAGNLCEYEVPFHLMPVGGPGGR